MIDSARTSPPIFIRKIYRFLRYKGERKKLQREIGIRKKQDQLLGKLYNPAGNKLIIFIVPGSDLVSGKDKISGGVISIVSICEETSALSDQHMAQTIMCTAAEDHLLLKHEMFDNETWVYRFPQVVEYFRDLKEVIIHIPEFMVEYFVSSFRGSDKKWLDRISSVQLNIMNQNIVLMPEPEIVNALKPLFSSVTITTAHQKYCSPSYRKHYGVPIHKLSVWMSPEQYQFTAWKEKENLIVISPDPHPQKEEIIASLKEIPGLEVVIIQGLTYYSYKQLISRAKWSLTFGEGLDGYLIEPVFSGAIAFAVYNELFFTQEFANFETIYPGIKELKESIVKDMERLDNQGIFPGYQKRLYDLCAFYYSKEQYRKNISAFYRKDYTYA
jgi:hypothetical protein